ncbi:MAG: zinc ribbon domain-containing protein [Nitrospinae bacterium]|nr:zinc ribbon domain-containing protein [Nitrospinota bacterium]
MECPKCGHKQPDGAKECERCGIIFSKWRERQERQERGEPSRSTSSSIKVQPLNPYAVKKDSKDWVGYIQPAIILIAFLGAGLWIHHDLNNWREFTSPTRGFTLEFPGTPESQTDSSTVRPDPSITVYLTSEFHQVAPLFGIPGIYYAVMVADYKYQSSQPVEWDDEKGFAGFRDGVIKELGFAARVESQSDVEIAGYRGKEYNFSANIRKATIRVFRKGDRMYALAVMHPPLLTLAEDKERFFGSLRLE